jgi:hypothetical protein
VLLKTNESRFLRDTHIELVRDARIDNINDLSSGDRVKTRSGKRCFILNAKDARASAARALKVKRRHYKTALGPNLSAQVKRDAMGA